MLTYSARSLFLLATLHCFVWGSANAGDEAANAIVARASEAMGTAAQLQEGGALRWKMVTLYDIGDGKTRLTVEYIVQNWDRIRMTIEEDSGDEKQTRVYMVLGNRAWMEVQGVHEEMEEYEYQVTRREMTRDILPVMVVPLMREDIALTLMDEQVVGEKRCHVVGVVTPEMKLRIAFDKSNHLPSRLTMDGRPDISDGVEIPNTLEMDFDNYKDFDGIQKATRIIYKKRGKELNQMNVTECEVLDQVDAGWFSPVD